MGALIGMMVFAQVNITKVGKVSPTDEVFMDMAVTAASKSKASGGKALGAVVILNGAWKGTGTPTASGTAEENAIAKSRLKSLKNASVFTVVEPTTKALEAISEAGAEAVYFAVSKDLAIEKGLYTAADYGDPDTAIIIVPVYLLDYAPALELVK